MAPPLRCLQRWLFPDSEPGVTLMLRFLVANRALRPNQPRRKLGPAAVTATELGCCPGPLEMPSGSRRSREVGAVMLRRLLEGAVFRCSIGSRYASPHAPQASRTRLLRTAPGIYRFDQWEICKIRMLFLPASTFDGDRYRRTERDSN